MQDSDRFAKLRSGGKDRHAIHDVDDRNDVKLKPGKELRHSIEKSGLIVCLDHGEAAFTVDSAQELLVVLISRNLPLRKSVKNGFSIVVVLLCSASSTRLPTH